MIEKHISINVSHWLPPICCKYAIIDILAKPCSYGQHEFEEGTIGYKSVPVL